jgi:signal transduction histidine kinase
LFTRARGIFLLATVLSQTALLIYLERASLQPVYYEGLIDLFILLIVIEVDTLTLFLSYALPTLLYRALAGPDAFMEARNLIYLVGPICFSINRFKAIASRKLDREKEMETMRRMVQAMAHQMKTPWAYVQQLASGVEFAAEKRTPNAAYLKQQAKEIIETARIATEGTDMFLMNASDVVSRTPFETTDVATLLQTCIQESFVIKLHPDLNVTLRADQNFQVRVSRGLFRNVLNNLLQNAATSIRHAGKGEIEIITKNDAKDGLRIEFKDSGLGLDPKLRRTIFNRGYGAFHKGTGYGLAFCAEAMHLFGGYIEATGESDNFAIFTLRFPNVI